VPEAALFAQSLLIGLSIAAPVGPIGLLVIQRTLQRGALVGLATGLGAAAADALVGARVPLAIGGGAFLLWLAWRIWHSAPADKAAQAGGGGLLRCFAGTFVLTLSNPATILSFIAVFGTLGARLQVGSPWTMVAGVLVGSALWWLALSAGVARLRSRFDARAQRWVNRASALLLAGFALWQLGALGLT
jgi:threonine/homoserine/homoserine lactone efflux protein